jgi:hypothetical protein
MSTQEERDDEKKRKERDAETKRSAEKARRREATVKRIKDIVWTSVIASVITLIVVTQLGWLTTQAVVEKAREEGTKELVALRASICLVRFQQRPDAETKLAEFEALSWSEKDDAIRKFQHRKLLTKRVFQGGPCWTPVHIQARPLGGSVTAPHSGLVCQLPSLLAPAGIMDHVANCLELGVDPKQEPRDRAEGDNGQEK